MGEVFLSNAEIADAVRYAVSTDKVRKLGPRLYTKNMNTELSEVVRRNIWPIVKLYFPGATLADRTALEKTLSPNGNVWVISDVKRVVELPGHVITSRKAKATGELTPFMDGLNVPDLTTALISNARRTRSGPKTGESATLLRGELEQHMARLLDHSYGKDELEKIKDEASDRSDGAEIAAIAKALLGGDSTGLTSNLAKARARNRAYDEIRVEMFEQMTQYLLEESPPLPIEVNEDQDQELRAFYESYFSNYIEGTRFNVGEAEQVVFSNYNPMNRAADAECVKATFRLARDDSGREFRDYDDFDEFIRTDHASLMASVEYSKPGEFKDLPNYAGTYPFVAPDKVSGTLEAGFENYSSIPNGLPRAIYAAFLVSEVHPFVDGNGRTSRLVLNTELTKRGLQRIILPNVNRDDYIRALKDANRERRFGTISKALYKAQEFSSTLRLQDRRSAEQELNVSNAFEEPSDGRLVFPG